MKKIFIITIGILLVAAACNQQAAVQTNSSDTNTPASTQSQQQSQGIVIQQPLTNEAVKLPITVKGYVNGNGWVAFEGVAGSVKVLDANNKVISEVTPLQIKGDWTKFPAYFEATVGDRQMMSNLNTETGVLVFESTNAKDDSVVKEFRLPIKFSK